MNLSSNLVELNSTSEFNTVLNGKKDRLILLEFYADWCSPCKTFKPIYERTSQKYLGKKVIFARVDAKKMGKVMHSFGIHSIPSLAYFKNKKALKIVIGVVKEKDLIKSIDTFLS